MKAFCYLILLLAFIMFYNKDPIIALSILGICIVSFLFLRKRKHFTPDSRKSGFFSFRDRCSSQPNLTNPYMMLLLLQVLSTDDSSYPSSYASDSKEPLQKDDLQQTKDEILALLQSVDL